VIHTDFLEIEWSMIRKTYGRFEGALRDEFLEWLG